MSDQIKTLVIYLSVGHLGNFNKDKYSAVRRTLPEITCTMLPINQYSNHYVGSSFMEIIEFPIWLNLGFYADRISNWIHFSHGEATLANFHPLSYLENTSRLERHLCSHPLLCPFTRPFVIDFFQ